MIQANKNYLGSILCGPRRFFESDQKNLIKKIFFANQFKWILNRYFYTFSRIPNGIFPKKSSMKYCDQAKKVIFMTKVNLNGDLNVDFENVFRIQLN